jgi:hypothetical protein
MAKIGQTNRLRVVRQRDFGVYLDADNLGDILLPLRDVPENIKVGDELDVFIYLDSEDLLIATTKEPAARVGECAYLKVVSVGPVGAFLDWGLPKDLLVPFNEQEQRMVEGRSYVVHVYLDNSNRLAASSKLNRFLGKTQPHYQEGQRVDLIIDERTDLGYKAVVNHRHWGMLYHNETFRSLRPGERTEGYIKQIRTDGKIDLYLQRPGFNKDDDLGDRILTLLKAQGGFLAVTDKSPPAQIQNLFGVSKKRFKMTIGSLYKQRLIALEDSGIRLSTLGDAGRKGE